ncbi:hypothetical protein ACVXHA_08585 [Escherichia coli]
MNEPRAHDYSRRGNPTRDVVQRALAVTGRWCRCSAHQYRHVSHPSGNHRLFETWRFAGCAARPLRR